jgi:hypothetical protein
VQVLVWNDVADITDVEVGYCAGADDPDTCTWNWVTASSDPNYDCGTNCGIYNAALSLTAGDYWLLARALSTDDGYGYSSDGRTGNDAKYLYIKVLAAKTGTGMLLVRDNSSRMCMDCHTQIQSHSSQSTDDDYGNWQIVCLECHTPHNTRNLHLIKEQIITPNSGVKNVVFYSIAGDAPSKLRGFFCWCFNHCHLSGVPHKDRRCHRGKMAKYRRQQQPLRKCKPHSEVHSLPRP